MSEPTHKHQVLMLWARAAVCRAATKIRTNGGHDTDRLLLDIARQLEREAATLVGMDVLGDQYDTLTLEQLLERLEAARGRQ